MAARRALIPRKVMDDAAAVAVATNSVVEVEGAGFKLRITPSSGARHMSINDGIDDRLDQWAAS